MINGSALSPIDLIGKAVLNVIAMMLLGYVSWTLCRRQSHQVEARLEARRSGVPCAG